MKITSKGQVTIPQRIRERYGLLPHHEVAFKETKNGVLLQPAPDKNRHLRTWLNKVRGSATVKVTTDEIMKMTRGDAR